MGTPGVSATGKAAGGPAAWADVAAVDHGAVVVLEKLQPAGARALDLADGALRHSGVDQLGLVTPRGSKYVQTAFAAWLMRPVRLAVGHRGDQAFLVGLRPTGGYGDATRGRAARQCPPFPIR